MKNTRNLILSGLLALLALAAIGLVLTHSWVKPQQNPNTLTAAQAKLVDEHPLQEAQRLANLAVTPEEQQFAAQAMRFADNEVDLAFESALRDTTASPAALSAEAKQLQSRIQRRQGRVDAEQQDVTRLTSLVAKAPASKKDSLQQQLELAQAQLSLDQDELADAHQDLIRAGGDPHSEIEQMLQEHEQSEVHKGTEGVGADSAKQAAIENTSERSVLAQFRAWKSLNSKRQQLDAAHSDAANLGVSLSSSHEALEAKLAGKQATAPPLPPANTNAATGSPAATPQAAASSAPAASASSSAPTSSAEAAEDTAARISHVRALSSEQKDLASFDKRIEDEQQLASVYANWSAFVVSRERFYLHGLLISVFWILLIACAVLLADSVLAHFFRRLKPDRKRMLTLRSVSNVGVRTVGMVIILLLIFGMPSQFATVLALAGAGLTVALKDFIVGFLGWFVLMGANGIRPGDWVEINGVAGEVFEVGLLHTILLETGNWSDAGHPTGRKVTFVNSFAIEGHYFNFSTSGQWMWDELQVSIPTGKDPYAVADEIKKIVSKETEKNARLAEKEWERVTLDRASTVFKAEPAMNLRPSDGGVSVAIRYITRANERSDLRSHLYRSVLDLLHRKRIPKASEALSPQPVPETD